MNNADTGGQKKLVRILEQMGYHVETEKHFEPYTVDIYLQHMHLAVEYDGTKWHSFKKKDKKRDDFLMEKYSLPVQRINEKNIGTAIPLLESFIVLWSPSAKERKLKYEVW